ncbi:hypothetical protein HMPREF0758_4608 [Serratia odorifera DSM 4582]|uniref:Uncharacterized protein n=1 Tax=Serratia odorifera DSM 4582 TaxID=667129 RepID=D4E8V8_SEROD|nr:hypothetical protein HMPREF0758_4608 [Serratia odorifera DSM 4582]
MLPSAQAAQIFTKTSDDLCVSLWHNARQITFPMKSERCVKY